MKQAPADAPASRATAWWSGAALWIAALAVGGASAANAAAIGSALGRPLLLPFLWRSLGDADAAGTPAEAFAKARLLLEAVPGWADGHIVFAYRYALEGADRAGGLPTAAAAAAHERLQVALAMLDDARASCPKSEVALLSAMAFLVELASNQTPGLATLLDAPPMLLADHYLAAAERLDPGLTTQERRLFLAPLPCAALLQGGDRAAALALLDAAIDRGLQLQDQPAVAEWLARLDGVRRHLRGQPGVDLEVLRQDPRLEPLTPFLR